MMKTLKDRRGFTLVEIIIACGIIVVVMGGVGVAVINLGGIRLSSQQTGDTSDAVGVARTVMLTEEGCMKNVGGKQWDGTAAKAFSVNTLTDLLGTTVLQYGYTPAGKSKLDAGGVLQLDPESAIQSINVEPVSKIRSTATQNVYQAKVRVVLQRKPSSTGPVDSVQKEIPIQVITNSTAVPETIVSCYSMSKASDTIAFTDGIPTCGAGSILRGIDGDGRGICLPAVCGP